jgi:hypothetical protein
MLNIFKEYPKQEEGGSMLNVCLTEDLDTVYNLYFCSIKNGVLYDYSVPGRL